jgi:hypothetical protein
VRDGTSDLIVPTGRASVAVTDLDGDGRKDLVLGNTEGQVLFYANVGTDAAPQFAGSQTLQADNVAIDLADTPRSRPLITDFNQDGISDLLVGAADGLVRLYVGIQAAAPTGSTNVGNPGGTYVYAFRVEAPDNSKPWQCPVHPLDVNHDGDVTPLDALVVLNYVDVHGLGVLPLAPPASPSYVDANGDGKVTPLDVLWIVNDINLFGPRGITETSGTDCTTTPTCKPEGEASSPSALGAATSGPASGSTTPASPSSALAAADSEFGQRDSGSSPAVAAGDRGKLVSEAWWDLEDSLSEIAADVAAAWAEIP